MTTKYKITPSEYEKIHELRTCDIPFRKIKASLLGRYPDMPTPTLRKRYYKWIRRSRKAVANGESVAEFAWAGESTNSSVLSCITDDRAGRIISTLEELLDVAEVDLKVWRVVKWKPNSWGQMSNERGYSTMYQVVAWLERIVPINTSIAIQEALKEIRHASPHIPPLSFYYNKNKEPIMYEINLSDAHIGKRSWEAETGVEYNIQVAKERLNEAVAQLVAHSEPYNIEHIVIAMCGDMINADGPDGKTTRGTQQDMSGLYLEIFRSARRMIVDAINIFAQIAPVKVIIVSGNHDKYTSYLLADMIEAIFWSDNRVAVDNTPLPRKYHRYGKNLIGFAHKPDHRKLPGLMAIEQSRAWGETDCHEFHAGHFHKEEVWVDTIYDVVVRTVPALSSIDGWHKEEGYVGSKPGAQAFLWHKEKNLVGNFNAKF